MAETATGNLRPSEGEASDDDDDDDEVMGVMKAPPLPLLISQTVVHLPSFADVLISSLLTRPFTADPIPSVLIQTKSHHAAAAAP